jgi:hypothetical protein
MNPRKDVIKHSAAVHIQNDITLLQRRIWNVLLANAYDALPTRDRHCLRVKDLMQVLEFDSNNGQYLKEALEALVGCKVQWNVLDKENQWEWGITTLLAEAKIKHGLCTYAYGPTLRERLHNPQMYARISLSMQNKFEGKHAEALWEVCVDYLGAEREYGETPFIPLATYRILMGIAEEMYPLFKLFNQRVVKEPIAEINRVTDFRVTVDYQRVGRKVNALKFKIRRVLLLPLPATQQPTLFPDLHDLPVVVKELQDAGLALKDALDLWQQGFQAVEDAVRPRNVGEDRDAAFVQYIREKIHLLKTRQASGKVTHSTGFLLEAIRRNYTNPEFAAEQQRQATQAKRKVAQARKRDLEQLRDRYAVLKKSRDEDAHTRCAQLLQASPALLEEVMAAVLTQNPLCQRYYDMSRTSEENYREALGLWAFVDIALEQQYPECFQDLCDRYDADLTAMERHIATLEQPVRG